MIGCRWRSLQKRERETLAVHFAWPELCCSYFERIKNNGWLDNGERMREWEKQRKRERENGCATLSVWISESSILSVTSLIKRRDELANGKLQVMQSCTSFQPRSSIDLQAKLSRDQSGRVHCQQLLLFGGEYRISRTCLFYKKAAATPERIFGCTAELMCASVCLHFCTFVPRNTKWKSCTIWRLVPKRTDNSPHWLIVLIDQSSSSREQEHLLIGKRHKKKGSQLTDENITELRWSNRWYSDCIFHFTKYIEKKSKLVFS